MGGSSAGIRQILKSPEFAEYINKNEHLDVEVYLRRGKHPYMSSTYINGYVKDVPLLNKDYASTMRHVKQVNSEFGRRPMRHNHNPVISSAASIQGLWDNDDKWNNYPKHLLEKKNEIPVSYVEPKPLKELKDRKR